MEDENLRSQWNALVERTRSPQVFYTYEWALAVTRAFSDSLSPLVWLAYDEEGTLCGVAALAKNLTQHEVSFLCATTGDYCDFLSALEERPAFLAALFGELKKQGATKVVFANLPEDSGTLEDISQIARQQGYFCFARPAYECAQVLIDRLEKGKDGKPIAPGLSRISRFAKKIGRQTPIHFDHKRCWDDVQPIVPQFIKAHVARFLATGRISNYAHARRRTFLEELSKLLSDAQSLVLSRMIVGERVVAWQYGFQFHGSWFLYQPTFDSIYEKHWPGFCLLTHVIQQATENPALTTVDLGLGAEVYKAKFANGSRQTLYVTLHSSLFGHLKGKLRYRAAAAARAYPLVERFARALQKRFRSLRARVGREGTKKTLRWAASRALRVLWADDAVLFYEFLSQEKTAGPRCFSLRLIDLDLLASAVRQYSEDEETLTYLLRCAKRLRIDACMGFALVTEEGTPVHFCWAKAFEGFEMAELGRKLQAPCANAVMIFDCFTPVSVRGHGYFVEAIAAVARRLQSEGKVPWIFAAAANRVSVRGIEKTGFAFKFSLGRRKMFGFVKEKDSIPMRDLTSVPGSVPAP